MSIIEQLSTELGIAPQILTNALAVGLRQSQLDALYATIQQASQIDAVHTESENDALAPLIAAKDEKQNQRRSYIAALTTHYEEARNTSSGPVNIPTAEKLAEGLGVEVP